MNPVRRILLEARALPRCGESGPLRDYENGEDTRRIDWIASARTAGIRARDRERDLPLTWSAIVDTSPSMNVGRKRPLVAAAREAAAFWRTCAGPEDSWLGLPVPRPFDLCRAFECALTRLPARAALLVAGDFYELFTIPRSLIGALSRRFSCTALLARDPWFEQPAIRGFVGVSDIETGKRLRVYAGAREFARFAKAVAAREKAVRVMLREAGWRAATFDEDDDGTAVLKAFYPA